MILLYSLIVCGCAYTVFKILGVNKKLLSLYFTPECGSELIKFLITASASNSSCGSAPPYKFYSGLVEELVKTRNRFGAEIRESLREIRKALVLDLREEKKIKDAVLGGYFQYLFMSMFIWAFIYMAQRIIELPPNFDGLYIVASWQALGGALLVFAIKYKRERIFAPFELYFEAIYQMKALLQAKRPLSEVVAKFEYENTDMSGEFRSFGERIQTLCLHIKRQGSVDLVEFDYLLCEIWDHFEIQFMRFSKYLAVLKMLSVLLFMLPSFFLCIGLIFSQMAVFE